MQNKCNVALFHENIYLDQISEYQKRYITESTYSLKTPGGGKFQRTFELLALHRSSGEALVKEKVLYNKNDRYEKIYLLSREGKTQKYPGNKL